MKIFAWCTPEFQPMADRHFLATLPSDLELKFTTLPDFGIGAYDTPTFNAFSMAYLLSVLTLLNCETEPFAVANVDIRFYAPRIANDLLAQLAGHDIAFQQDGPDEKCFGFYVVRPNDRTRAFFRAVLAGVVATGTHDQGAAHALFQQGAVCLDWIFLNHRYWTQGRDTGQVWQPGDPVRPPSDLIMHHANWCIGFNNKMALLEAARLAHG